MLRKRQLLKHPSFVSVRRYWVDSVREPCSLDNKYTVTIEYEFYNRSLENKIKQYCEERRPFPELELRRAFSGVVMCLKYLEENQTCHGDVKPQNILFDWKQPESNAYLLDSYFINGGKMSSEMVMEDPESMSLLSPQQLENLRNKKFGNIDNIHKDEIFAVGLTMLEAMTAEPAMECYDLKNLTIKSGYFDEKYQEMREYGYSEELASLVTSCLHLRPESRPTFDKFLAILKC